MRQLTADQQAALRTAVKQAEEISSVSQRLAIIYRDFQSELDRRKPRCDQSGRCCRFDQFGHLLFVTTAELAVFRTRLALERGRVAYELPQQSIGRLNVLNPADPKPDPNGACQYQSEGLCTVHSIRPFGCRIFFCDPTSVAWQEEHYTRFHDRIRRLHNELAVPYFYVEWRQGLMALEQV